MVFRFTLIAFFPWFLAILFPSSLATVDAQIVILLIVLIVNLPDILDIPLLDNIDLVDNIFPIHVGSALVDIIRNVPVLAPIRDVLLLMSLVFVPLVVLTVLLVYVFAVVGTPVDARLLVLIILLPIVLIVPDVRVRIHTCCSCVAHVILIFGPVVHFLLIHTPQLPSQLLNLAMHFLYFCGGFRFVLFLYLFHLVLELFLFRSKLRNHLLFLMKLALEVVYLHLMGL